MDLGSKRNECTHSIYPVMLSKLYTNRLNLKEMKLKIITFTALLFFGILGTFSSCKGQINPENLDKSNNERTIGKTVSALGEKTTVVFQDKNNHYWFAGGGEGVYRYDGKSLVLYTKEDGLCSNTILGIQEDQFGNIYFDTPGGVSKFDLSNKQVGGQRFTTLEIIDSKASKNEWKLEPNDLWFRMGWDKKGPYRYDGKFLCQLEFPKSDLEDEFYAKYPNVSFSPYGIYTMYRDDKGSVWFGTASLGLCRYDGKSINWLYEKHLTETPSGGAFGIRSIIEDENGYFWFCNTRYRYEILPNNSEHNGTSDINYRKENGIGYSNENGEIDFPYFMSITKDNNGDLWMVTYSDGVWRNDGEKLIHYPIKDGGADVLLFSIYKDKQDNLWLGTHSNGVYKFNGEAFEKFELESNLSDVDPYFIETKTIENAYGPNSITRNIIQDRNGNIWLASWEGIIHYDGKAFTNFTNKEGLRRFHVFSILEDKRGNIWFGTIGAGVYRYDPSADAAGESLFTNFTTKEGLVNNTVTCIYEDKAGNIWFGTQGGLSCYGLSAEQADGKSFRNFTTKEGLINNDINAIIEDKAGKFWIGTRGNACFYDGETFTEFTTIGGLPFKNVRSIIEDKKGNIWLGGNDGLWKYDGVLFSNFTSNFIGYIYEDKKGNIWTSSEASGGSHKWVLSRYDEKSLYAETATATQVLGEKGMFFGILEDKEGSIWLGTLDGVCRYDGKTFNRFKKLKNLELIDFEKLLRNEE